MVFFTLGDMDFTTFVYEGRFDPNRWYELLEKYKITNIASVPTCI
jgi:acyl-coenzyme A synthetase/AMP-(fatty) acid ligase